MPIDDDSVIADSARIEDDSVHIEKSRIDEDTSVDERAEIVDSEIGQDSDVGADTEVVSTIVGLRVEIGAGSKIHDCVIDDGARIGDNVTLEHTHVKNGSVIDDETYVSESTIGGSVGYGCNIVESVVEEGSDVERNCQLVACTIGWIEPEHWRRISREGFAERVRDPACFIHAYCDLRFVRALGSSVRENTTALADAAPSTIINSAVGANCVMSSGVMLSHADLSESCSVGHNSILDYVECQSDVVIGPDVEMDGSTNYAVEIERNVRIEESARIYAGVFIGEGTIIEQHVTLHEQAEIGGWVTIKSDATVHDGATVGNGAVVGPEAGIGMHAQVGEGAQLGARAWVEEATEVPANYVVQPDEAYGGQEGETVATVIPITATSEVWLYERLAEIANGKLTKEAIKNTRPELLNHALTQELLRMRPRPTRSDLSQMARDANRDVKYMVEIVENGWDGLQRIGRRNNDVMRFNYADELLESVTASLAPEFQIDAKKHLKKSIKEDNVHETATERTLGWIRYFHEGDVIVVEELQTDVAMLRSVMGAEPEAIPRATMTHTTTVWGADDPLDSSWTARHKVSLVARYAANTGYMTEQDVSRWLHPPKPDSAKAFSWIPKGHVVSPAWAEGRPAEEVAEAERLITEAKEYWHNYEEALQEALSNFLVMTHDLYETMLATMLDYAAGRLRDVDGNMVGPRPPVDEVYLLTHETKSEIRASGRVPVYPYKKLPARFQSARKVPLPSDVPRENYQGVGLPKARLLRPNQ